jgi:hypothetical protein
MKETDKKPVEKTQVRVVQQQSKETSGDKKFDSAIDLLLKKMPHPTPTK